MSKGRGPYFQLVRSYRNEDGDPRQEVLVHLGVHETLEAALSAWPSEVEHMSLSLPRGYDGCRCDVS
jgi:hypothetical protein